MGWRFSARKSKVTDGRNVRTPETLHKPASFQYSSNRMAAERGFDRGGAEREQAYADKLRLRLRRVPYALGLICLLVGAVYLSTLSTSPQIILSGGQQQIRAKQDYQKAAEDLLKSKLANRSKISFNGQQLAEHLQDKFSEIKTVNVSTPLVRHRPVIELSLASPALVFVSGSTTYLLDERGIVLFDTKQTSHQVETSQLPVVSDQTSFSVEINKPALSSGQVQFVNEIVRQTADKKLEITSMELVGGGGQLDVRFKDLRYKVKFNFYEEGRRSAGAFLAAKEQLELEGTQPSEYIDVRIPTRAYVK